jgi:tetratricopeptide (TPR) repeat protein
LNYAMNCHFSPALTSWVDAVPALKLALQYDSDNCMAMTMLCFNTLARARIFGWRLTQKSDGEYAQDLIERAQSLKSNNEVVRMVHGALLLYVLGDHRAARIEAEESLKLNPDFYHSINLMSQVELFGGDIEKTAELAQRSIDCDPAYPYLHLYQRGAGYVHAVSGRYPDAINCFERADRGAPGLPHNLIGLAASLQLNGNTERAQKTMDTLLGIAPDFNLAEAAAWPFRQPTDWEPFKVALSSSGGPLRSPLRIVEGGVA